MERDQGHGYRYDGGHSVAQGYGHAYAGYDDNATEHLVSGRQDGENTLSPGEQEDDQDDGVQTRQHGGGRPRDPIWSYFTEEPRCKYCNWKPDFPKAFRMRNHAMSCTDTPASVKAEIQADFDEKAKNKQEKAGREREKPPPKKRKKAEPKKLDSEEAPPPKETPMPPMPLPTTMISAQAQSSTSPSTYHAEDATRSFQPPPPPPPPLVTGPPTPSSSTTANPYGINAHLRTTQYLSGFPAHHVPTPSHIHHTAMTPPARSPITCHVLDSTAGRPAIEMRVRLDMLDSSGFNLIGQGETDGDGRCTNLLEPGTKLQHGIFKITFYTSEYFTKKGILSFYPFVEIPFEIKTPDEHYHIPLLLSPYSYTTYRGS